MFSKMDSIYTNDKVMRVRFQNPNIVVYKVTLDKQSEKTCTCTICSKPFVVVDKKITWCDACLDEYTFDDL